MTPALLFEYAQLDAQGLANNPYRNPIHGVVEQASATQDHQQATGPDDPPHISENPAHDPGIKDPRHQAR